MLLNSSYKIIRHSNIKGAVFFAGKNINVVVFAHLFILKEYGFLVKPGMTGKDCWTPAFAGMTG